MFLPRELKRRAYLPWFQLRGKRALKCWYKETRRFAKRGEAMRTRSRALLIVVVLTALGAVPALASTVTVDEYGNGFFDSTPLVTLGPTLLGVGYTLPFAATDGTLFILPSANDGF